MASLQASLLLAAGVLFLIAGQAAGAGSRSEIGPVIEKIIYSDPFELGAGEVLKKWYPIQFPEGVIGLRSINAELVDANFNPVPLDEAYLHHWTIRPFADSERDPIMLPAHEPDGTTIPAFRDVPTSPRGVPFARESGLQLPTNEGPASHAGELMTEEEEKEETKKEDWKAYCESGTLRDIGAWFGVGSETRHTNTSFPAPYAVVIGDPNAEKKIWKAQIHAIDTRETADPWGCIECLCSLYDTNGVDELGREIPMDYVGGYFCCYTGKICKLKDTKAALEAPKKKRYLKITIQYVPYDECVIPVRIYFMDVAACTGEYNVPPCEPHRTVGSCVHKLPRKMTFPNAGHLVFAEGHLHYGGIGINMLRENGDVLCDSLPLFGRGANSETGNEAGYVTGMGVCEFPNMEAPLKDNETVVVEATYSRLGGHTGVMGQFVVGVAVDGDYTPPPDGVCLGPEGLNRLKAGGAQMKDGQVSLSIGTFVGLLSACPIFAVLAAAVAALATARKQAAHHSSRTPLIGSA